jgi:hypothetical protein
MKCAVNQMVRNFVTLLNWLKYCPKLWMFLLKDYIDVHLDTPHVHVLCYSQKHVFFTFQKQYFLKRPGSWSSIQMFKKNTVSNQKLTEMLPIEPQTVAGNKVICQASSPIR